MLHRPMPLVRVPEPFDHSDWLFELKHDGFRALAYVASRRPAPCWMASWSAWATTAAASSTGCSSVVTGPFFFAFDVLEVDGEDLRDEPLITRKRRLRQILRFVKPSWARSCFGRHRKKARACAQSMDACACVRLHGCVTLT
jgi:bifunctional non-homologous end joining protein LigD